MNRWKLPLAWSALVVLLAACAAPAPKDTATLTYETKPEGATLYVAGQPIGMAPQTRSYKLEAGASTIKTPEVTAVWPSGAKTGFYTFLKPGADDVATLERPAKAPDLQKDLDHAAKVVAGKEAEQRRLKEEAKREQTRNSARCQQQQQKGQQVAISDC